jgi:hypothetical protein
MSARKNKKIIKIQTITPKHDDQPCIRKFKIAPSPLKIHPNNPPPTKRKKHKTMIPIIPSISISRFLFV